MESISSGSTEAIHLVNCLVASMITFISLTALISGIIEYAGSLLGYPGWSLELLFGYALFPIAYLIGVTDGMDQALVC